MGGLSPEIVGFAAALGVGLLIGIERERSKGTGPHRRPGGIRTFALFALAGATAEALENLWLAPAAVLAATAFATVAYHHRADEDPGLTTEIALVVTSLLGILAYRHPATGAGLGVVVAIMLAAPTRLHRFVLDQLNAQEVHDGLLLAAAALVVLPLLPNQAIDPLGAFNPRVIWALAVLVMAINAAGYVALRAFGAAVGLPLSGFAGGFVSSRRRTARWAAVHWPSPRCCGRRSPGQRCRRSRPRAGNLAIDSWDITENLVIEKSVGLTIKNMPLFRNGEIYLSVTQACLGVADCQLLAPISGMSEVDR